MSDFNNYVKCCYVCSKNHKYSHEVKKENITFKICQHSMKELDDEQKVCEYFDPNDRTKCCFTCRYKYKIGSLDHIYTLCQLKIGHINEYGTCESYIPNELLLKANEVRIKLQDKHGWLIILNDHDATILINFMSSYLYAYLTWHHNHDIYGIKYAGKDSFFYWKTKLKKGREGLPDEEIIQADEFKRRLLEDEAFRTTFYYGKAQFETFI